MNKFQQEYEDYTKSIINSFIDMQQTDEKRYVDWDSGTQWEWCNEETIKNKWNGAHVGEYKDYNSGVAKQFLSANLFVYLDWIKIYKTNE